ncbi:MAG: (E)-4-hydroxy-3-methylbut-2-enyl-diphosphate synthase [Alistipes indistinctus]
MTNTDTNDTEASAAQVRRIAGAGGEIVRLTAQGRREAANLAAIRARLREEGCSVPLVADIHFVPEAALVAAENVEKVRINPGNFNDRGGQFDRLVALCREHGTALRIGVNHGSLSAAVMERYGDTPEGMVASAVEYLGLCRERGFDPVVVSLKSSNVRVMVQAYRLLAAEMRERSWDYPLHLGVTEAGDDMEGRIKSAVGIGALLADGLGDTIRVSLTEAPEREIPVARQLADYFAAREGHAPIPAVDESFYSPYEYRRRRSEPVEGVGGDRPPVIWSELPEALRGKVFTPIYIPSGRCPTGVSWCSLPRMATAWPSSAPFSCAWSRRANATRSLSNAVTANVRWRRCR